MQAATAVRTLVLTGTLCLSAGPVAAQGSGYGARALSRLAARLGADATLPDSLRHLTVADLLGPANTNNTRLLDDASSSLFMRTTAATLHQAPDSICGGIMQAGAGAPDLDVMLPFTDSTTGDAWVTVLERIVRARAAGAPGGRMASDIEVRDVMMAMLGGFSVEDQTRLITIARNPPPSAADGCWSIRMIMDGLAAMPDTALGPVVRAMFGRPAAAAGQ